MTVNNMSEQDDFQNKLFINDNLGILNGLNSNSVDLVYLDPPFNSKRCYNAAIGSHAEGSSFKDIWTWQAEAMQKAVLSRTSGHGKMSINISWILSVLTIQNWRTSLKLLAELTTKA